LEIIIIVIMQCTAILIIRTVMVMGMAARTAAVLAAVAVAVRKCSTPAPCATSCCN
jgi:hypothetical protein